MPDLTVAVIQSNYIPWLGYFAMAGAADVFVVYEDVQYTKNDWRNRNRLDVRGVRQWLTVPVRHEYLGQNFMEVEVANNSWTKKHYETLRQAFSRSPGWALYGTEIESLYKAAFEMRYLYEINRLFLKWAFKTLNIRSRVVWLSSHPQYDDPTERLVSVLTSNGATRYLSGPSAADYIDKQQFDTAGIALEYVNYEKLIPAVFGLTGGYTQSSVVQHLLEVAA